MEYYRTPFILIGSFLFSLNFAAGDNAQKESSNNDVNSESSISIELQDFNSKTISTILLKSPFFTELTMPFVWDKTGYIKNRVYEALLERYPSLERNDYFTIVGSLDPLYKNSENNNQNAPRLPLSAITKKYLDTKRTSLLIPSEITEIELINILLDLPTLNNLREIFIGSISASPISELVSCQEGIMRLSMLEIYEYYLSTAIESLNLEYCIIGNQNIAPRNGTQLGMRECCDSAQLSYDIDLDTELFSKYFESVKL